MNDQLSQAFQQLQRSSTELSIAALLIYASWICVSASFVYAVHRFVTALEEKWKHERIELALRTEADRLNAPFKK